MLHYPVTKQLCLALCTVKCIRVSREVTRTIPNFFIYEISNFGTAVFIQKFHICIQKIARNLAFFCSFCRLFTLYITVKNVGKLTVIQMSTVPHNSVQISFTPHCLLCRFVVFWRAKLVYLNFAINKNSQLLKSVYNCHVNIYYNAKHSASKIERVKNARQEKIYVKAKELSSQVTK